MLISANNITQKKTQTDKLLESIYIGLKDKRFYALAPETCDPDVYLTVHKLAKSNTKQFRGTNHLFLIIIQLFTRVIHFFRGNIHFCFGNILLCFGKKLFCFGNIPLFPSINVSLSRKNRHCLEIFPPFLSSLSLNLLYTYHIVQRSEEMNLLTFKTL